MMKALVFFFSIITLSLTTYGQEAKSEGTGRWDLGFHMGSFLPKKMGDVTEDTAFTGLIIGVPFYETHIEVILNQALGYGAEIWNGDVSYRFDFPAENNIVMINFGPDLFYWNTSGNNKKFDYGGHLGGGLMTHLGGALWFRGDMKLNVGPGLTAFVGVGLVARVF